jgi:CMP-N,N'-diacetyllegionaminic acid synthase
VPKRLLAIITARGGSKRLPGKNLLPIAGKSLIAHAIDAAQNSCCVDRVICSTDSEEIAVEARKWGCEVPFIRPSHLARDDASSIDTLVHAVTEVSGYDYVVLLQPTSPCRLSSDIDSAVLLLAQKDACSCIAVTCGALPSLPAYSMSAGFLSRQTNDFDGKAASGSLLWRPNGALYITSVKRLLETRAIEGNRVVGYPMSSERSADIDTQSDFDRAVAALTSQSSFYGAGQ